MCNRKGNIDEENEFGHVDTLRVGLKMEEDLVIRVKNGYKLNRKNKKKRERKMKKINPRK